MFSDSFIIHGILCECCEHKETSIEYEIDYNFDMFYETVNTLRNYFYRRNARPTDSSFRGIGTHMIEIKSNLSSDYVFNITSEIISSIRKDNNIITYLKAAAKAYSNMTFTEIVKELYHFYYQILESDEHENYLYFRNESHFHCELIKNIEIKFIYIIEMDIQLYIKIIIFIFILKQKVN